MYIVAIGWMWVVLLMSLAEAMSANGTVIGALVTFVLYGVFPLSILLYVLGTPARRRARRIADEAEDAAAAASAGPAPDGRGQTPADAVAAERKET